MNIKRVFAACIFSTTLAAAGFAHADAIYTVTLNTSAISGAAGYALAFSFQDGSGTGDSNNIVTLGSFDFGVGGSVGGGLTKVGGAQGDLTSSVVLQDTDFSNLFAQGFTPGASLSFKFGMTTNVDAGSTPDFFGFSILTLPTLDDTLGDNFLYLNIDSASPTPYSWATDPLSPVALNAPTVVPTSGVVPEPGTLGFMALGATALGILRLRRKALNSWRRSRCD